MHSQHQDHKRSNDEDVPGPDSKKTRNSFDVPPSSLPVTQNHMQRTKHKYCDEIYRNLRAMFPNIDKEYIKNFCPANWSPGVNHDIQFNRIVDTIFLNEHSWVMADNSNNLLLHVEQDDNLKQPNSVDLDQANDNSVHNQSVHTKQIHPEAPSFQMEQTAVTSTILEHSLLQPSTSSGNEPNDIHIDLSSDHPVQIQEPNISHFEVKHVQNEVLPITSTYTSPLQELPVVSSNSGSLENLHLVEHVQTQPNTSKQSSPVAAVSSNNGQLENNEIASVESVRTQTRPTTSTHSTPSAAVSSNNVPVEQIENIDLVSEPHHSTHIDLGDDLPYVSIQEPESSSFQGKHVQNKLQSTTPKYPSLPPAVSSNNVPVEQIENIDLVSEPHHSTHIDLGDDLPYVSIQEPESSSFQGKHVQNKLQSTTPKYPSLPPAVSSNNVPVEQIENIDLVSEPHHTNYIDLCDDSSYMPLQKPKLPHIQVKHIHNERQPASSTSTQTSPQPSGSLHRLFMERMKDIYSAKQTNQTAPIDLCNDNHPMHIQKPKIPHFEMEHVQNQELPTMSKHSTLPPTNISHDIYLEKLKNIRMGMEYISQLHRQSNHQAQNLVQQTIPKYTSSLLPSNNLFLQRTDNMYAVNQLPTTSKHNQNDCLIHTQINQPVPKIPQVKVEHTQNHMQPGTSRHSAPLPAGTANIMERTGNMHTVNQPPSSGKPKQNSCPIHNQINQPMRIQQLPQVKVEHAQNQSHMQPTTSKPIYCEEIYHKLRAMFPDIDMEYIKSFCPANWSPGVSHDIQFNSIVDKIFMNEHSWVLAKTPINTSLHGMQNEDVAMIPNVDDTYEQLAAIFPNADPHYLRSAAERFKNENDITEFINAKLQKHDYPTREQYLAKMRVTEEQQRYTKDFNVEQFLTLFTDPFKHFENDARKCTFNLIANEFLKNIFSRVRVNTINRAYRQCKYNISVTAKFLRDCTDFIGTARRAREIPTEDIQLLQEMAFVRHHDKILQHIQTMKQREEEEFNLLKTLGGLYTCQCCFDEECMPSKTSTCGNGHIFCNSCIISGTDTKLADGETHVPCFMDCGSEFSIATFQKVLPPTKLCIFLKKRQAAEVAAAGLEGLVCCPFCDFASIPPEGDKVFKCFNPECMKESCIKCKEPNHVPYTCGDKRSDKARQYIEEKMTEALIRTCYKCNKTFFKEEGCNKMTCTCGAHMCYICNQPVGGPDAYKHFRGQGSDEVGKCPLWTDNQVLNVETVRKVEEEARREILRQDPTMNINTNVLAPAVQPSRPGPHVGISDAHNLANVLAARVLNNNRFELK